METYLFSLIAQIERMTANKTFRQPMGPPGEGKVTTRFGFATYLAALYTLIKDAEHSLQQMAAVSLGTSHSNINRDLDFADKFRELEVLRRVFDCEMRKEYPELHDKEGLDFAAGWVVVHDAPHVHADQPTRVRESDLLPKDYLTFRRLHQEPETL